MKEKCEDGVYESAQEFVDDMALLFDNGDLYNKVLMFIGSCIHRLGFTIIYLGIYHDFTSISKKIVIFACGYIISIRYTRHLYVISFFFEQFVFNIIWIYLF